MHDFGYNWALELIIDFSGQKAIPCEFYFNMWISLLKIYLCVQVFTQLFHKCNTQAGIVCVAYNFTAGTFNSPAATD